MTDVDGAARKQNDGVGGMEPPFRVVQILQFAKPKLWYFSQCFTMFYVRSLAVTLFDRWLYLEKLLSS